MLIACLLRCWMRQPGIWGSSKEVPLCMGIAVLRSLLSSGMYNLCNSLLDTAFPLIGASSPSTWSAAQRLFRTLPSPYRFCGL